MKGKIGGLFRSHSRGLLAGLMVLMLLAGSVSSVAHADTSYTVQSGDTLSGIALRYGVTIDAIVTANGLGSRTIYAGQVLRIPSGGAPAQPPSGNGSYTVQPGDSLSGIAYRFGTTVDALMRANNLSSTAIYAGQVLKIVPASYSAPPPSQPTPVPPSPTSAPQPQSTSQPQPQANPSTYVVQPGDNLTNLAKRFGVTLQALAAANGISPTSFVYVGQVLTIPGTGQSTQPKPAASTPTPVPPTSAPPPPSPTVPAPATTTPQPVNPSATAAPGKPVQYTVQPGDTLSSIAARFKTTIAALIQLNNLPDQNYVYSGQVLTVVPGDDQNSPAAANNSPPPEPAPPMGALGPKWVDVNLTTQMMVAYEGQTPVYSSKISSGVANHPTVEGTFRVYARYVSTRMTGGEGAEHYDIPNVPYTLYFYSGYALHGAYWHNNFGHPMSHGCVNLPVDVSKWIYDWAPLGTLVVTHE